LALLAGWESYISVHLVFLAVTPVSPRDSETNEPQRPTHLEKFIENFLLLGVIATYVSGGAAYPKCGVFRGTSSFRLWNENRSDVPKLTERNLELERFRRLLFATKCTSESEH